MVESLAGKLLVASLLIREPNFFRTVILMCAHDDNGALGIVLNRPLAGQSVADHLPQFDRFAREPACLFSGGPVEPSAALALGRWQSSERSESPNLVVGSSGLLDLSRPLEDYAAGLAEARLFAGYAGWGGGQLEGELEQESWFVVPATEEDAFSRTPETLWRDVLRRQPGKLAMFAFAPADPAVN
jgi:putative transcriptional regulator